MNIEEVLTKAGKMPDLKAEKGAIKLEAVVGIKIGLYARPCAMLVKQASKYDVDITYTKEGNQVSGKNIMGLLTLEAYEGSKISVDINFLPGQEAEAKEIALILYGGISDETIMNSYWDEWRTSREHPYLK